MFAEVLPHPHSLLLNCVIIFKQINSIAEFSRPNDEFAVQMPLISHSPENQLMNGARCFFGEALRQPAFASGFPGTLPHPALSCCLQLGLRSGAKGDPKSCVPHPHPRGRNVMAGPSPALVTQGEDFFLLIIDFSPRQDLQRGRSLEV